RGLVGADLAGAVDPPFDVDAEAHAELLGDGLGLEHHAARHLPRAGIGGDASRVAWVSALIGLKQRLPQSFSQISSRIRSSTGARRPASVSSALSRSTLGVSSPEGSP